MSELIALLRQLEVGRFYGSVEVRFEAGQVTVIRKRNPSSPERATTETIEVMPMSTRTRNEEGSHSGPKHQDNKDSGGDE